MNVSVEESIQNAKKDIDAILADLTITVRVSMGKPIPLSDANRRMIISRCKLGDSTDEINKMFPYYTVKQIAAVKGHCTINTYKEITI
jgi:hypothetical protein